MASAQGRKNSNSDIKKSQKFKTVGGKSCDKSEECEKCSSSLEMDQKGITKASKDVLKTQKN